MTDSEHEARAAEVMSLAKAIAELNGFLWDDASATIVRGDSWSHQGCWIVTTGQHVQPWHEQEYDDHGIQMLFAFDDGSFLGLMSTREDLPPNRLGKQFRLPSSAT
jgi:hypothetical protein